MFGLIKGGLSLIGGIGRRIRERRLANGKKPIFNFGNRGGRLEAQQALKEMNAYMPPTPPPTYSGVGERKSASGGGKGLPDNDKILGMPKQTAYIIGGVLSLGVLFLLTKKKR